MRVSDNRLAKDVYPWEACVPFTFLLAKLYLDVFKNKDFKSFQWRILWCSDKTPGWGSRKQSLCGGIRAAKSKQQELLKCTGTEQTLALGDCNHHFGLGWDWTGPKEGQKGNGGIDTRAPGRETREKEINSLVLLEPGWSFCRKRWSCGPSLFYFF